ncbi:TatD family deoxyribonuclease [Candidatus Parcubacteria bacterium]|nr:MAG: TatD family deoxyribonuclease [Candidatus Parcubacteria bacterium]
MKLIDTHAHMQFPAYDADRAAVLQRARDAGVAMINVGTQYSTSQAAIELATREGLWATAGFHPGHLAIQSHHDAQELREPNQEEFSAARIRELAAHGRIVAIGECGLDYYRLSGVDVAAVKQRQREVFGEQIAVARDMKKPLVIHCRQAFADLIAILNDARLAITPQGNGVIHFFSGTADDAKALLDLGFFLGFGGVVTFAREYDEALRFTPHGRLLLETDAPYVAPVPHRGKRNEPTFIIETAKKIAELRDMEFEELAARTTANAKMLFGL